MPIVRQLPKMCLRGSLSNITMKNLAENEAMHVSQVAEHVRKHPEMVKHKIRLISSLRNTIGQDFKDFSIGSSEYDIAIWKGTVELFYHRNYQFYCGHCNSNTYLTKRGSPSIIDRQQIPCPNCSKVELISRGDTDLPLGKKDLLLELGIAEPDRLLNIGDISIREIQDVLECTGHEAFQVQDVLIRPIYIDFQEFQDSYKYLSDYLEPPEHKSSIYYIQGDKKYKSKQAQRIIEDPVQLTKFYGQFVNNYFKQQIVENKRRESHTMETVVDKADKILTEEILALCRKMNINHLFYADNNPINGYYTISLLGLLTPPEFTCNFLELQKLGDKHSITILQDHGFIRIKEDPHAIELRTTVPRTEHILVTDDTGDEKRSIDQISSKGTNKIDPEDHEKSLETLELIESIRNSLPNGLCQDILDIYLGVGENYVEYSLKYGDSTPKKNHMAEYFSTNTKTIKSCIESIKIQCLAFGFVPGH